MIRHSHRFSATQAWLSLLTLVQCGGLPASPRGQETLELLGSSMSFDMSRPVIFSPARKLSYKFMAAEAAWILSGSDDAQVIASYNKRMLDYSDDGRVLYGAYGPRYSAQVDQVILKLAEDRDTRQAVFTLWRPNPQPSKDIPCTVAGQLLIRDDTLHGIFTMRSSDSWLGWPYDAFSFTMMAYSVAIGLGDEKLRLGTMTIQAGSQHLYAQNYDRAREVERELLTDPEVARASRQSLRLPAPLKFKHRGELIEYLWSCADRLVLPFADYATDLPT